jgi:hypothetical protein
VTDPTPAGRANPTGAHAGRADTDPAANAGPADTDPADTDTEAEADRDRDPAGRPRQARPRDALGRPLQYGDPGGVTPVPEQALPPAGALALAQSLLDGGRAFAAHEVLEASWKAAPAGERDLWQGLAQICVAITHGQRGNITGAARLLRRGAGRLRPYAAAPPHGVDVPGVLAWCDRWDGSGADPPQLRQG